MKRTKLKKKSKGLRRQSKDSISKLQRKLWELIKIIIRKKYAHTCYTCGRTGLTGSNLQTSHLWPKAALGAYLKYDLRILRICCFHCNINLGGNGAVFYKRMLEEIGPERMQELEADRQKIVKAYDFYSQLLPKYTEIIKSL